MRWPWTPRPCERCKALERRLDDLEADVDHLGRQMVKLRGRVTGGLRREREAEANGGGQGELLEVPASRFDYLEATRLARAKRQGGG